LLRRVKPKASIAGNRDRHARESVPDAVCGILDRRRSNRPGISQATGPRGPSTLWKAHSPWAMCHRRG